MRISDKAASFCSHLTTLRRNSGSMRIQPMSPTSGWAPSLVVEHRFAVDIVEGVKEAGFEFKVTQHEWSTP